MFSRFIASILDAAREGRNSAKRSGVYCRRWSGYGFSAERDNSREFRTPVEQLYFTARVNHFSGGEGAQNVGRHIELIDSRPNRGRSKKEANQCRKHTFCFSST
jgi:hypothetical protein